MREATMLTRRHTLASLLGPAAAFGLGGLASPARGQSAAIGSREKIRVTKLDTFVLTNSWVFVKITTDTGIVGWGEMLKDDAKACAAGALEVGDYLIGQDPTRVVHHWQAIHRGAFYRGGPVKTAISSGIDQALWDITGKVYNLPVHKLLGGATRDRCRVYGQPNLKNGVNAMKVILRDAKGRALTKHNESDKAIGEAVENFAALRKKMGPNVDIGVEFHGAVQPTTAMRLMAALAAKTRVPLATGERIFTKWGFKEILEKKAAMILQPDVCYAGGITELKIIAGMAEAYYTPIAPHNPQGPCSLAASFQIDAAIPNFLIQERGDNEYADLLAKPLPPIVNGYRPLLTEPGLGITIDEDKLRAQVGEPRPYLPQFDADDGSVVDW
jgi:galactonate dehydratase